MTKNAAISALLFLCLFSAANPSCGLDLNEGRYEITSKVEMKGMPTEMPPVTITQCLTQQDPVPDQTAGNQQCRITDMKTRGNTVTWEMTCDQQGQKMKANGEMTYLGDKFQGTITTEMGPQAGNMVMTTHVSGRRIGPCQ